MGTTKAREMEVKLYLNGFPKSGTHILNALAARILRIAVDGKNWLGNTPEHAFGRGTTKDKDKILKVMGVFTPNTFIKGHMAYDRDVAEAMQENGVCKAFIFRDFRDVAVSIAYHMAKPNVASFPNKEYYQALDFDTRLGLAITGDELIGGVMERWEQYAPWLDEDWVLKLTFEDYIEHPEEVCRLFLRYVYGKTASYAGYHVELERDSFEEMVRLLMLQVEHPEDVSPTYRKGKIGEWKSHFTEEHKRLLKKSDTNNWLVRLGYADNRAW